MCCDDRRLKAGMRPAPVLFSSRGQVSCVCYAASCQAEPEQNELLAAARIQQSGHMAAGCCGEPLSLHPSHFIRRVQTILTTIAGLLSAACEPKIVKKRMMWLAAALPPLLSSPSCDQQFPLVCRSAHPPGAGVELKLPAASSPAEDDSGVDQSLSSPFVLREPDHLGLELTEAGCSLLDCCTIPAVIKLSDPFLVWLWVLAAVPRVFKEDLCAN